MCADPGLSPELYITPQQSEVIPEPRERALLGMTKKCAQPFWFFTLLPFGGLEVLGGRGTPSGN